MTTNGMSPNYESSFSLSNRLGRFAWHIAYVLIFTHTPRTMHRWRAFILRIFGAKLGKNCHIYPKVRIWSPWNLECGSDVGIADGVIIYNMGFVSIGSRAVVSQGSHLCAGTHDYTDDRFLLITKPITIGAQAWICAEAFIHPGVTIGEGAVIGARAVVSMDMPPWMVCAGHPCAPIKARVLKPSVPARVNS